MILIFYLDRLRWGSGQAFRDVFLQLRHVEDIVDLVEPAPEVKSIGYLPYELHYPERSHKPSSELPSICTMKGFRRE